MAQPSKRQRGAKTRKPLWKNGLITAGAGAGLLLFASAVAGKHPFIASAVSMPAWWTLGLGALLILLHLAARLAGKRRPSRFHPPHPPAARQPPPQASALMALIDRLERETLGPAATEPPPGPPPRPVQPALWQEESLTALSPHAFVALCKALFEQVGFATRSDEQAPGRGTAIWLEAPDIAGPVAVVQCQPAKDHAVDAASMHALQVMITARGLRWGASITRGSHSAPAMALAARCGIHALGTLDLQHLISRRSTEQQTSLRQVAEEHSDAA